MKKAKFVIRLVIVALLIASFAMMFMPSFKFEITLETYPVQYDCYYLPYYDETVLSGFGFIPLLTFCLNGLLIVGYLSSIFLKNRNVDFVCMIFLGLLFVLSLVILVFAKTIYNILSIIFLFIALLGGVFVWLNEETILKIIRRKENESN